MEKLLTIKEVSEILGYTKDNQYRFVRKLRKDGYLQGVKIGTKLLFKEADVERFIEKQFEIQNRRTNEKLQRIKQTSEWYEKSN